MVLLLNNHLNNFKDNIFQCLFKRYSRLLFFKKWFFSEHIIMESLSLKKENIIKDVRNL